jgi:cell division protein FtsW
LLKSKDKKIKSPDWWLFFAVMALLGVGIIMVFSSSQYQAQYDFGDPFYYLKGQGKNAIIGLVAMLIAYKIPYQFYKKIAWPLVFFVVVLLLLVLFSGGGEEAGGAVRWLSLGGIRFQPSELCKLAMVILLAKVFSERQKQMGSFTGGFLPGLILIAVIAGLIFAQNDLSTAVIIALTGIIMMYCAGAKFKYLLGTIVVGLAAGIAIIAGSDFRSGRIEAYLDPWQDPLGAGFQTVQSLLAVGNGGLTGVGLGAGGSKWYYLPEGYTDFIFAVLAEEMGFLGGLFVIALFGILVWRGLMIAIGLKDSFASLLAVGITSYIGIQAFINIGVVTGLLPVTGITLPFISYGGTSLIICLVSMGILLNLSRYSEIKR